MSEPVAPPVEPMDEPKRPSRQDILNEYWWEFFAFQLQEYEKRCKSGWGVAKGLFTESEFWEWLIAAKPEVIKGMIAQGEEWNDQ